MNSLKRKINRTSLLVPKYLHQLIHPKVAREDKKIIFVAGTQRSGTNMIMGAFERNYDTQVFHERDPRAFQQYEMRSIEEISKLIDEIKVKHIFIKALCELQDLPKLLDYFSGSKCIWIYRDFDDVVNSHIVKWTGMPDTIQRIVNDRSDTVAWRGRGMSDDTFELVKKCYQDSNDNATSCALFWYFRNILFFERDLDKDPRVKLVKYEDLVRNPEERFKMLSEFCELEFSVRMNKFISTSSINKSKPSAISIKTREICQDLSNKFDLELEKHKS